MKAVTLPCWHGSVWYATPSSVFYLNSLEICLVLDTALALIPYQTQSPISPGLINAMSSTPLPTANSYISVPEDFSKSTSGRMEVPEN